MRSILAGIETEYGLLIEGHGAEEQIEHSKALVRSYPGECFVGWDYRYESPRADLRGFKLDRLAYDPEDAKFDRGRAHGPDPEVRSDRILPNGARLYNDHGHPEYATPECFSILDLARQDHAGQFAVLKAAAVLQEEMGARISVYKNNTDFHGASYGTHESYLVPRELGFERLYAAVLPMLVVRQILTGAGKVGSETGRAATYQISQRADFFAEAANAETLFRRPIFNTRDEPHADPSQWIRLHVISGDANMITNATARKIGLLKLALHLCEAGTAPPWKIKEPVRAFQAISRDETYEFCVELEGRSWSTAYEILESYFAAAESTLELDEELQELVKSSRKLLNSLATNMKEFAREVDWAAKKSMLEQFMESEGCDWREPSLRAYDLEYHNVDPEESLHAALEAMGQIEANPKIEEALALISAAPGDSRARARGLAVSRFHEHLSTACWHSLSFDRDGSIVEVALPPDAKYPAQLAEASDVGSFIENLRRIG